MEWPCGESVHFLNKKETIFHLTKVRFPNVASQLLCDVEISAGIFCLSLPGDDGKFAEPPRSGELSEVIAVERIYY